MAKQEGFWSSWQERLTALRNVPPVLKIVWDSGPGVVLFGLIARVFAALMPLALLWIPKIILDQIDRATKTHQPVGPRFWWLVAAEFGTALLFSVLARTIDYSDSLLGDKYTRYVSIRVKLESQTADRLMVRVQVEDTGIGIPKEKLRT